MNAYKVSYADGEVGIYDDLAHAPDRPVRSVLYAKLSPKLIRLLALSGVLKQYKKR